MSNNTDIKLVTCVHRTTVESDGEHNETATCSICGQVITYIYVDGERGKGPHRIPYLTKVGRLGGNIVAPEPKVRWDQLMNQDLNELTLARDNCPKGPVTPETASPDAPESKSEGAPSAAPGSADTISQEIQPAAGPSVKIPRDGTERMDYYRKHFEVMLSDYRSMETTAEFIAKWEIKHYQWYTLLKEFKIATNSEILTGKEMKHHKASRSITKHHDKKCKEISPTRPLDNTWSEEEKEADTGLSPLGEMVDRLPPFISAPAAGESDGLPMLPPFSYEMSKEVQIAWLETWLAAYRISHGQEGGKQ
jgi:hypothetical protein